MNHRADGETYGIFTFQSSSAVRSCTVVILNCRGYGGPGDFELYVFCPSSTTWMLDLQILSLASRDFTLDIGSGRHNSSRLVNQGVRRWEAGTFLVLLLEIKQDRQSKRTTISSLPPVITAEKVAWKLIWSFEFELQEILTCNHLYTINTIISWTI